MFHPLPFPFTFARDKLIEDNLGSTWDVDTELADRELCNLDYADDVACIVRICRTYSNVD